MKLSREQRKRLLDGDYAPLTFDVDPEIEAGKTQVLSWSARQRISDGRGNTSEVPRRPLFWITVTQVSRRAKGGWTVRFDVQDNRDPSRLPRRTPPAYGAPDELIPTEDEIKKARLASSYTSDHRQAVDHFDSVDDAGLAQIQKDSVERADMRRSRERLRRERHSLEARVGIAKKVADIKGIDISPHLRALERRVLEIERMLDERLDKVA